ncbi:hypothetical protein B0H63DRAFT_458409 [Podospora didyma]|uniref:CFEM domain-containing protein n=1 Tax=Podospora didyma TaxID=330526 RepID=A0AAE0P548_9PEZI|nr:hypothetical protein B0H63DRAFT_458409 [Podospora didyma]
MRALLFFILLHTLLARKSAAGSVSIASYSGFSGRRACVKDCLWHQQDAASDATLTATAAADLIAAIGCSPPWVDACYCLPEQASTASSFLSSCVANRCDAKTIAAVTSAIELYRGYCSAVGSPIPVVASITAFAAYRSQPDCVQLCLWHAQQTVDDLMPAMGCGDPWANDCLCDVSRLGTATTFLSTCVASRCVAPVTAPEVTSAVSVYGAYCSSAGLPLSLAAVAGSSSSSSSGTGIPTSTAPPATAAESGGGGVQTPSSTLSTGAIAGISVAAVAAILLLGISAAVIMYRKRKARRQQLPASIALERTRKEEEGVHEKPACDDLVEADEGYNGAELPGREPHTVAAELPLTQAPAELPAH